jgi:hypothetical protein
VEVVSGQLFEGASDMSRLWIVDIDNGRRVAFPPPEDMIADRMGQYASTSSGVPEMLEQAIKLLQLAGPIDETYLDGRIKQETNRHFDLAYLKAHIP